MFRANLRDGRADILELTGKQNYLPVSKTIYRFLETVVPLIPAGRRQAKVFVGK